MRSDRRNELSVQLMQIYKNLSEDAKIDSNATILLQLRYKEKE